MRFAVLVARSSVTLEPRRPVVSENSIALRTQDVAGLLGTTFGPCKGSICGQRYVVLRSLQEAS